MMIMDRPRVDEIVFLTFNRHTDYLAAMLKRHCDNAEVAFSVGRYIGMMQKELENELDKEITRSGKNEID